MIQSIAWKNKKVRFLDQTKLPAEEKYVETSDIEDIARAIITLQLRGAPLIGIAAGYGLVLGIFPFLHASYDEFITAFDRSYARLSQTRPTAKNLFWALERMRKCSRLTATKDVPTLFENLENEAIAIHREDAIMCEAMGKFGQELIPDNSTILTHCNTGALATGGIGTALGVIASAHKAGKKIHVYVDETRPLLQGARLTMWELEKLGISSTLITDNSAAWTIKSKNVTMVITGADRIAANGDSANKIGTLNIAILAKEFGIPFYIAAPTSTIDLDLATGDSIPIEERGRNEVVNGFGSHIAPATADVFSPAFDVTPNKLITAIITERGVHTAPYEQTLTMHLDK